MLQWSDAPVAAHLTACPAWQSQTLSCAHARSNLSPMLSQTYPSFLLLERPRMPPVERQHTLAECICRQDPAWRPNHIHCAKGHGVGLEHQPHLKRAPACTFSVGQGHTLLCKPAPAPSASLHVDLDHLPRLPRALVPWLGLARSQLHQVGERDAAGRALALGRGVPQLLHQLLHLLGACVWTV